ncbi:MAG TPA: hypothetical protein DCL15_23295 [Chloroflexi bacterium]|nr:hypothetical protein [Chloroflexota bacterium]HHW86544.1 hypothetical protein [Chloroflexota bacterium]
MSAEAFSVVLSHAELAYLLSLFAATPTIGVDRNPFDGLSTQEIAVAHATARDALRARDLLRLDAEARPLVKDDLLRVLESYARPNLIVTAYRYVAGENLPLTWFAYRRADAAVIHMRPDDLLHAFALVSDAAALTQALADFCAGGTAASLHAGAPLTLPARALAAARAHADTEQADQVAQVLRTVGLDDDTAAALAADLNNPTAVTAITCVATGDDARTRRRDAIFWQSTTPSARLIVYTGGDAVQISGGGAANFLTILNEMM